MSSIIANWWPQIYALIGLLMAARVFDVFVWGDGRKYIEEEGSSPILNVLPIWVYGAVVLVVACLIGLLWPPCLVLYASFAIYDWLKRYED